MSSPNTYVRFLTLSLRFFEKWKYFPIRSSWAMGILSTKWKLFINNSNLLCDIMTQVSWKLYNLVVVNPINTNPIHNTNSKNCLEDWLVSIYTSVNLDHLIFQPFTMLISSFLDIINISFFFQDQFL